MIEIVESILLARQISRELGGKRIVEGMRGNSPHKFAFYSGTPEEYAAILPGKVIGEARDHGPAIRVKLEPGYELVLGEGGERITYHRDGFDLPKKHQLLLGFEDGGFLSVSVQGWGAALLLSDAQCETHPLVGTTRISPLSHDFTRDYFEGLLNEVPDGDPRSVKFFVISKPQIWGVGNGYLQDILYRARLHPRRRMIGLSPAERDALYEAAVETLRSALDLGGRDTEFDLFGRPGGYIKLLDSRSVGQPCNRCETPIVKEAYLGGAVYFCPRCQQLSEADLPRKGKKNGSLGKPF
jgi:formamidopyrimidine-DNA glycosylase